jgi:hypothetical protein
VQPAPRYRSVRSASFCFKRPTPGRVPASYPLRYAVREVNFPERERAEKSGAPCCPAAVRSFGLCPLRPTVPHAGRYCRPLSLPAPVYQGGPSGRFFVFCQRPGALLYCRPARLVKPSGSETRTEAVFTAYREGWPSVDLAYGQGVDRVAFGCFCCNPDELTVF